MVALTGVPGESAARQKNIMSTNEPKGLPAKKTAWLYLSYSPWFGSLDDREMIDVQGNPGLKK
jgi:hypothetical protein